MTLAITSMPALRTLTPGTAPAVEDLVGARQELARLEEILLRLPPGCRQVFLLRKVEDLTHEEIARVLGISRKTVENHMTRAYRLLREAYQAAEALPKQKLC